MDDRQRRWLDNLAPRIRAIIDRVGSGASSSEHTIGVRRIRGRRVRLRLIADYVDDDEEVIVSRPFDPPIDADTRGAPMRKARRTRRL